MPDRSLSIVLGTPTAADPERSEPLRHPERVVPADGHHRVDAESLQGCQHRSGSVLGDEGIGPRGAQHGPAQRQEVLTPVRVQVEGPPFEHAPPAVEEPHRLVAVDLVAGEDHRTDDRVQSRAVATAGQDADAHPLDPLPPVDPGFDDEPDQEMENFDAAANRSATSAQFTIFHRAATKSAFTFLYCR